MAGEMLDAQREWLPQFARQRIRTLPSIHISEGTRRAEVPLDPPLAVAARFGQLAEIEGRFGSHPPVPERGRDLGIRTRDPRLGQSQGGASLS